MEKTQGDTSVTPITPKSDEHIQAVVNAATLLCSHVQRLFSSALYGLEH